MKKFLPKTVNNPAGFTLIELLVVIAIMAILAIIGIAILSGTQSKARDSKRKEDIAAISQALEANYQPGTGYSTTISTTWFSDQVVPKNPSPGGADYYSTGMTTSTYTLCTLLENSTGNATGSNGSGLGTSTGNYYCKKQQQ